MNTSTPLCLAWSVSVASEAVFSTVLDAPMLPVARLLITLLNWWTRYRPRLADPAEPASVRKAWPKATILIGSADSGRMRSMYIPASGTSAVPVKHSGESTMLYTCTKHSAHASAGAGDIGRVLSVTLPRTLTFPGACYGQVTARLLDHSVKDQ